MRVRVPAHDIPEMRNECFCVCPSVFVLFLWFVLNKTSYYLLARAFLDR